jgi:hypothetical protein
MFRQIAFILFFLLTAIGHAAPLVTCEFRGQMGNQMWQIAATVGYALEYGYEPIFPGLKNAINGIFNAQHFFHRLNTSCSTQYDDFLKHREFYSHTFTPIPNYNGQNVCLDGHFESPSYFEKYKDEIQKIFAPTEEIVKEIHQKYGELLTQGPLVAVHVRTYIPDNRDPIRQGFAGGTWNYFVSAMKHFPSNAHFVVFSDAIEWTKTHFPQQGKKVTFIEGNPYPIDFYLMSLCDHVIVSPESTFSWWAAWLNQNPNKIVIVADEWGEILDNHTIPSGWIKIPKKGFR